MLNNKTPAQNRKDALQRNLRAQITAAPDQLVALKRAELALRKDMRGDPKRP